MDARNVGRAGLFIFVGVVEFAFFFVLSEVYYPGYSVSSNYISDLGATCVSDNSACVFAQPSSTLFNVSITVMGVLLLFGAFYLWKGFGSKLTTALSISSGVALVGVGVFNESYGIIHGLFSLLTFVSTGAIAVSAYRLLKPPMSYFSLVAGLATLAAIVLYVGRAYMGLGAGGMERMVVYPVLLWGIGFGGHLMGLARAMSPEPVVPEGKRD